MANSIKVDLGCGKRKTKDYIGVDIFSHPNVDIVADLNQRFPFDDNSVDEIKAHDIIEHLTGRIHTMNEIWRILKPNGIVEIRVPSTDGRGAFQDPTHVSFWNINSFKYYTLEYPPYLDLCKSYGFKGAFNLISLTQETEGENVIHVRAILRAVKETIDIHDNEIQTEELNKYIKYCQDINPQFNKTTILGLIESVKQTNWDEPQSPQDYNNVGVMALIEAENANDSDLRIFYLEIAQEAFQESANSNLLCAAHLAMVQSMIGEEELAYQIALGNLIKTLHFVYNEPEKIPQGLIYFPPRWRKSLKANNSLTEIKTILSQKDGYNQVLFIFIVIICQCTIIYNSYGLRYFSLATHILSESLYFYFLLGIAMINQNQLEGLYYLQQARTIQPENTRVIQALYLFYRFVQDNALIQFWHHKAREYAQKDPHSLSWQWVNLNINSVFTYLPFDDILLAVEPSLQSYVTSVLLGSGDWFEQEIEFWRSQIKPEMTVIDVGANVGVYTFSAAKRVGEKGKVIAVEPFSDCVARLRETCRVNNFDWVTVCAGAAGETNKKVRLSLHAANELNEIISDESEVNGEYQEVDCFTLDSMVEKYDLKRVDWIKIDAEGYEMEVLQGSIMILKEFRPNIIYENIDPNQKNHTLTAEFLLSQGYELFYYQPFTEQLIPIESTEELAGHLNIIALPSDKK